MELTEARSVAVNDEAPDAPTTRSDLSWAVQAACVGKPALFFPPFAERPQTRAKREARAKSICAACPVQDPCRTYGRVNREYGIWGGENEEERVRAGFALHAPIGTRHLVRQRRAAAAMQMPLSELDGPSAEELEAIERGDA